MSEIRTRDTSLRAVVDWCGPHSVWAVIDAAPLNVGLPLGLPPAPPAAARHIPARGARGRTQPLAPVEPSQPPSSRVPATGGGRLLKRIRTVWISSFPHIRLIPFDCCTYSGLLLTISILSFQQEELEASTFVAFETAAAAVAEEVEVQAAGGEAVESILAAQAK